MPRKTRRPSEFRVPTGVQRPVLWPRYVAIALVFALLGAGAAYTVLRPALRRAAAPRPVPAPVAPAANTAPSTEMPPADLTANLAPPEAARAQGNWYEDHQQWAQAIASYTQAINSGLDNPDIRTDLGVAYYKNSQLQNALTEYQAAQQQNPRHENSLFNQAIIYAVSGDSLKATDTLRTYIRRFPQGEHVADARLLIKQIEARKSKVPFTPTNSVPSSGA